ncbi:MAG: bifunctional diaminohydroxyphosphoribosylaminopyrimidine deaminase/5-amino-6-(5-phosphoribosylamino)uracil reductase RibD [Polyangiaceae bacterium]|nr:bifunctional diaminohydroxyphosphoribosylaminopyrimidine deaminase/5-amino-6-(5-phosphoribosylamino)uracil reductase RibD [Polyangiaceae bacterium]
MGIVMDPSNPHSPQNHDELPPVSSSPSPVAPRTEDDRWMDLALTHARNGNPSPNPHVGAIVVKNGQLIAAAHHERAGGDHAEVAALRAAGDKANGAILFVTLEPCNHQGRTPQCTDTIIAAKVARVVVGVRDPNPHVDGQGIEKLQRAGIEVVVGVREAQARLVIARWEKYVTTGLPYVSLKLALSLDGRIATRSGASKWVTGADARAKVHLLRSYSDAVAVGIATALADDPRLTVRDVPGDNPTRVIFDTKLRLPTSSRLVTTARETSTLVLCGLDASQNAETELASFGVTCLRSPQSTEGRIDMFSALRALAQRGVVSLMVEGGAELAGSFLAGRFADELHVFVAPILLGPRGRAGAVDWAGPDTPQQAPRIASPAWELVGHDAYVHGPLIYPE